MAITHVVRGSEYLSSTPKYTLLYQAFGWQEPQYVHLPPVMKDAHHKLSKRNGDASFQDLMAKGYLPEAVINYIALLGWSPSDNREFFTLPELVEAFSLEGLSKSPAIFDSVKLTWMNGEYIKNMDFEAYYTRVLPYLKAAVHRDGMDYRRLAELLQKRLETWNQVAELTDFFDALPAYDTALYVHKKMKTTKEIALSSLKAVLPVVEAMTDWREEVIHDGLMALVTEMGIKNGQLLWPVRTALSGKPTSPGGATELAYLLGKEETIRRIEQGIALLEGEAAQA